MVRDEVLLYATIALLAFLAFYLMPTYERMTDRIEVDSATKAATAPTTAVTPQIAYPSKALFGPSHISPILDHKASEEPMRPRFPPFEQFTTMEEDKKKKDSNNQHSSGDNQHSSGKNNQHSSGKDNQHSSGKNNQQSSGKNNQQSSSNNGSPQSYTSRGNMYNLPVVTSDNTPPLTQSQTPSPYSGSGFQQSTLSAPSPTTGGANAPDDPLNQYVLKSSLVPYVCPSGACGTPNQLPSSKTPGDMDMPDYTRMKPNQKNIGRPRNEAFAQKSDEPQPFLTDFAPFTK